MILCPFDLEQTFDDFSVSCHFRHNICHFVGNSGTGKTFLFRLISAYCPTVGLKAITIDYKNISANTDAMVAFCMFADVVILDNADLYNYNAILDSLRGKDRLVLVSHHEITGLHPEDGSYAVDYTGTALTTRCRGD